MTGLAQGDMLLYANGGVTDDVSIALYMRAQDDPAVSIQFGAERITLEFYDVESLERLRDLAAEGARRLHVAIELNERTGAVGRAGPGQIGSDG